MTARHRLTPVERLARDICWADEGPHAVYTKAQYWMLHLLDRERAVYIEEAERFTWLVRKLGAPALAKILAEK